MNSLSWFIYAADVLPGFIWMGDVTFIATLAHTFLAIYLWAVTRGEGTEDEEIGNRVVKVSFKITAFALPFILLTMLIPSKETIYLIAGSEAGEAVVNTPEAKEMFADIQEVIKYQLQEMKSGGDE